MKNLTFLLLCYTLLSSCIFKSNDIELVQIDSTYESANSAHTELMVVNATEMDSVLVYLTLSGYPTSDSSLYVQNVNNIFGIPESGLKGSFYLNSGDTVTYTATKMFSGNIGFGTPPINCPNDNWSTGANIFEFSLNFPQESCDIGCVTGVNSIISVKLVGGANWMASNYYPNVREMSNDSMYKNTNRVGVMPYGCTNCINTEGKQPCQTPSETPDSVRICNPTRASGEKGGQIIVSFNGFTF